MTDPNVRRGRIRRLYGLTLIPEAELARLLRVQLELIDVCVVLYSAMERIARIAPYVQAREAIRVARRAMRDADKLAE